MEYFKWRTLKTTYTEGKKTVSFTVPDTIFINP